jgi:mannose-1-phosphate guanylyltransferase
MLHAVIMAGGSGTRFWPASRRDRPKQLLALASDRPLLRVTRDRLADLVPAERLWVVTTEATAKVTRTLLTDLPATNVLAEPEGRNTAACAGLAAIAVLDRDPDAVCVVLPADHLIPDAPRFRSAIAAGASLVNRDGGLLTFGIMPSCPETGYGYLELGALHVRDGEWAIHHLRRFVEKPDLETARAYVADGGFLWNAGIFAWRAREFLAEIDRHLPELGAGLARIAASWSGPRASSVLAETYPDLPATSIDFGIMERAEHRWVMPVDFSWSDVGSWSALADELPTDGVAGNAIRGRAAVLDGTGNVLVSTGPVVAAMGVTDVVVVATPDAVLVVPKNQAQRVKEIVEELRNRGWEDVL